MKDKSSYGCPASNSNICDEKRERILFKILSLNQWKLCKTLKWEPGSRRQGLHSMMRRPVILCHGRIYENEGNVWHFFCKRDTSLPLYCLPLHKTMCWVFANHEIYEHSYKFQDPKGII